jgi:hypothetical protein
VAASSVFLIALALEPFWPIIEPLPPPLTSTTIDVCLPMDPSTLKITKEGAAAADIFLEFIGEDIERSSVGARVWRGPRLTGDTYKPNQRIDWERPPSELTDEMVGVAVTRAFRQAKVSYLSFYRAAKQELRCGAHIWTNIEGVSRWNSSVWRCEIVCDPKACRARDPEKCDRMP